jgi:hypothetical protein
MMLLKKAEHMLFPVTSGFESVSLDRIVNRRRNLNLKFPAWNSDSGAGTFWDLTTIAAITESLAPQLCFEIGTGHGRSTWTMALNSPPDAKVYTLDIGGEKVGSAFREQPGSEKIRQIIADSKSYRFDEFEGRAGLVLIDGGHDHESVLADTQIAFRLVAPGGAILWHDLTPDWPGVISALRQSKTLGTICRISGTAFAYAGPMA